jgi:serine/threonine-protein kinase HipA
MPPTRLFEGKYFGVKRFDRRSGGKKIHLLSLAGLLNADYRLPSLDYHQLMSATLQLTKSFAEVEKMFRLMCFNVLADNLDDHAKNFAFLFQDGEWRVSPAYDLVKSEGLNGEHATMVDGTGKEVNEEQMMNVARGVGIAEKRARLIMEEVKIAVESESEIDTGRIKR